MSMPTRRRSVLRTRRCSSATERLSARLAGLVADQKARRHLGLGGDVHITVLQADQHRAAVANGSLDGFERGGRAWRARREGAHQQLYEFLGIVDHAHQLA